MKKRKKIKNRNLSKNKQNKTNTKRLQDHYYKAAKEKGYLARSVFKLEEIDNKYRLFKKIGEPIFILDLGSSPGSWLQYVSKKLKKEDKLIGVDISKIEFTHPNLIFFNKSIEDLKLEEILKITNNNKLNFVLSDMAPKTTGIKIFDQEESLKLCYLAKETAKNLLKKNGTLVIKIFENPGVKKLREELKKEYKEVIKFKPNSSRKESYEIFIIAKGFLAKT
jgi:23S rRNA (uridine2552-2'-O)-methyltransferase